MNKYVLNSFFDEMTKISAYMIRLAQDHFADFLRRYPNPTVKQASNFMRSLNLTGRDLAKHFHPDKFYYRKDISARTKKVISEAFAQELSFYTSGLRGKRSARGWGAGPEQPKGRGARGWGAEAKQGTDWSKEWKDWKSDFKRRQEADEKAWQEFRRARAEEAAAKERERWESARKRQEQARYEKEAREAKTAREARRSEKVWEGARGGGGGLGGREKVRVPWPVRFPTIFALGAIAGLSIILSMKKKLKKTQKGPVKYLRRWKDIKGEWRYEYPD